MGSLLVAWRESDDQPQCGGDVHAFHHERGGGAAAMPGEHECGCDDEGDHREGEFDAAARIVELEKQVQDLSRGNPLKASDIVKPKQSLK